VLQLQFHYRSVSEKTPEVCVAVCVVVCCSVLQCAVVAAALSLGIRNDA